jgi:mono/diheme cytochrome c family protein
MRTIAVLVALALASGRTLAAPDAQKLYAGACAACHGRYGKGDGPAARDLDPAPRDLTSRAFRFRTTATGELPRPEDVERTIRLGLPGTAMPAFDGLFSEDELDALVAFVYALHGNPEPPPGLDLAGVDPVEDATAVAEGRALYVISGCTTCHGIDGAGRGPASAGLTDDSGAPIRVLDFRHDPFKGGRSVPDVVRTLRTGLNGAPMPSWDEALSFAAEDVDADALPWDRLPAGDRDLVTAYLARAPGRAELDVASRTALRDRRIEALARYVLSLERRGIVPWLFRSDPERAGRQP